MKKLITLLIPVLILTGCISTGIDPELAAIVKSGKTLGLEDASITIEEYSDFQCPYCAKADMINHEIIKAYPQQVKIVYKHFPLPSHQNSFTAAMASECAREQGKFWEYANIVFKNQNSLTDSNLNKFASELQLDEQQFSSCFDDQTYKNVVQNELYKGSKRNITGTPTYFIEDQKVSGANKQKLIEAIEAQIAKNIGK